MKHTPGQWDLMWDGDESQPTFLIGTPDEPDIARVHDTIKEAEGNARLITAAPDLLEACEELLDGMVDGPNSTQKNVTAYAINMVRKAVERAKARHVIPAAR